MPRDDEPQVLPARSLHDDRRADAEIVVLGVVVVDERTVRRRASAKTSCEPSFHTSVSTFAVSRSTAVRNSVWSKMRASAVRTLAIASMPGASAAASAALVGIGQKLFWAVIA